MLFPTTFSGSLFPIPLSLSSLYCFQESPLYPCVQHLCCIYHFSSAWNSINQEGLASAFSINTLNFFLMLYLRSFCFQKNSALSVSIYSPSKTNSSPAFLPGPSSSYISFGPISHTIQFFTVALPRELNTAPGVIASFLQVNSSFLKFLSQLHFPPPIQVRPQIMCSSHTWYDGAFPQQPSTHLPLFFCFPPGPGTLFMASV